MRFLLFLSFLFLTNAQAANWVSIEPDRFNMLYGEGERASILFRILSEPSNPAYEITITVQPEGDSPSSPLIEAGQALFISEPLLSGTKNVLVTTRIIGPDGYERVVQENSLDLVIQPVQELR